MADPVRRGERGERGESGEVMLRFCSLNRVELAQTLFLCILRIRDSTTYHYIRYYELLGA